MKKLLILRAAAALATAAAAAAAPGDGATVTRSTTCVESPLATWCWDVETVTKTTTAPSGNVSYHTNGVTDYTVSFPSMGCSYASSEPVHIHWLTKDGELQTQTERFSETTSFACADGYSYSCTSGYELHLANGETRFQRARFECTGP